MTRALVAMAGRSRHLTLTALARCMAAGERHHDLVAALLVLAGLFGVVIAA